MAEETKPGIFESLQNLWNKYTTPTDGAQQGQSLLGYDYNSVANQNLLRSCKFAVQFIKIPGIEPAELRRLTYLCDSVEFPGQTLTTTDYRIPGQLKTKIPYARELSEVTFSFYVPVDYSPYTLMNDWIESISLSTTQNLYLDEIVGSISLYQFADTGKSFIRGTPSKSMQVDLINAYPLNVQAMPANWGDDGFHKLTASFFFVNYKITEF